MNATEGASVVLDKVAFSYGAEPMVFDLSLEGGTAAAIMGPSGSGKSTLLSLVAGFETPSSGHILIGGADVTRLPPSGRPVSMVFQENNLFSHLDVFANVALGRSPRLKLTQADRAAVADALDRVGLAGKGGRLPRELSGGERQRVALARVLVRDRPVLLLDEAFASLGPALKTDMVDLVAAFQAERGMTVLMVTHDPDDAARMADTVIFIQRGRVAAVGPARAVLDGSGSGAFADYLGSDKKRR